MATKTKRPLRRWDKCWVRTIDGNLEMVTYHEMYNSNHVLESATRGLMIALGTRRKPILKHECRLAAKPVVPQ